MANLNDLNSIPPEGITPGVHLDGDTGYITTPHNKQNHADIARILEASHLNPDDFIVDWSKQARITSQINAAGELVNLWAKLPFYRKPERTFDVQELVEHIHTPTEPPTPTHPGWLTVMLSDQHIGKAESAGGGTDTIVERWKESVTTALGGTTHPGINLVLGGDTIEGYVSQSGRSISQTDLVLSEQLQVAQQLVSWTIQRCIEHAPEVVVAAVPGNHSETTRVQNVPIGDNFDLMIPRNVEQAMNLAGLGDRVTFHYPTMTDGSVTYTLPDSTTFTVAHGHKFKGQMKGAENWWAGHIANGRHPADSHILLAGHFHNFQAANWTKDRWIMFAPSLETESTWFANHTGTTSLPGALTFTTTNGTPHNIRIT
nr:MAG TPA: DNA polymerase II small subunit [Caudoviricetes sp.]